jgi:hypothetical protein
VAEREAARPARGAGDPDDLGEVRAMLRRAHQLGLDPWRVLVALELPPRVRQHLLDQLDAQDVGSVPPQGSDA